MFLVPIVKLILDSEGKLVHRVRRLVVQQLLHVEPRQPHSRLSRLVGESVVEMRSCGQRLTFLELLVRLVLHLPVQVSLDTVIIVVVLQEAPHDVVGHDLRGVDLELSGADHFFNLVSLSGLDLGRP